MGKDLYNAFVFENYAFDLSTRTATFEYSFDGERRCTERIEFASIGSVVQKDILHRLLELAFLVAGVSYYKSFPTERLVYRGRAFSPKQAVLLGQIYREGLSQFMFENKLDPEKAVHVEGEGVDPLPVVYGGEGVLSLQSGGKDSLLMGELLNELQLPYTTWYMTSSKTYPKIIARLNGREPRLVRRYLDLSALDIAAQDGGLNGHVPVTYIALCYALVDAVLHGENTVLAAIGHEGDEPHAMLGDIPVTHQWSKTWSAERLLSDYVSTCISNTLRVGSPLRPFSELRIAEMFEEKCWTPYANGFSSCNVANYEQGQLNTDLRWCGKCPKCANAFILFSPFVIPYELRRIFDGQDLFSSQNLDLQRAFRGLLGIGDAMKPFECVGEVEELRTAYHMARVAYGSQACQLPFSVPEGHFDYRSLGPQQLWTKQFVPEEYLSRISTEQLPFADKDIL